MRSPSDVRRIRNHNATATTTATISTTSWSELIWRLAIGFHVLGGTGPMLDPTAVLRLSLFNSPRWKSLMSTSSMNRAMAGNATRSPTVAMILAASVARASGRKTAKSRMSPTIGPPTNTVTMTAGTTGQPRPARSS